MYDFNNEFYMVSIITKKESNSFPHAFFYTVQFNYLWDKTIKHHASLYICLSAGGIFSKYYCNI